MDQKQSIVVSGCSKGIGLSITEVLISKGFHVFGSVRREDVAERLAEQLGPSFTPLILDVTDETSVQKAAEKVNILEWSQTRVRISQILGDDNLQSLQPLYR